MDMRKAKVLMKEIRIVAVVAALLMGLAIPAGASHGQSSDTDSVYCPSGGSLVGRGYGHQWQTHVHDGQSWRAPNNDDWYWVNSYWGDHTGTQYVTVVAGGNNTIASALCPI